MKKIAIIGTGGIGVAHLEAIENTGACELCAVCDVDEDKVKKFSEKYQVPYFTDYREIPTHTEAEAVIISLPHFLHCECTVFFLEHGIDVLVEKPMANSVEECDRMITAAKQNQRKLAVGHVQRYYKANVWLKEAVKTGKFGKLCMISGKRSADYFEEERPSWFLEKEKSGGGIGMNYGAHVLDTLYYITGEERPEVFASSGNIKNQYNIEGHMQFMAKFPSGLSMCETLDGYNFSGHELIYYFENAVIKAENAMALYRFGKEDWEPIALEEANQIMERQLIDFCDFLEGKETMICNAETGRKVIETLERLYQQTK